jgi:hypothetical protein
MFCPEVFAFSMTVHGLPHISNLNKLTEICAPPPLLLMICITVGGFCVSDTEKSTSGARNSV